MNYYAAYGGGVNSTAMLLLLNIQGIDYEAVYVDHGGDLPETRRYVRWLARHLPITIIRPLVQGFSNIYEYLWDQKMVPLVRFRSCTDKFKIRPLHKYYQKPAVEFIGIASDERKRAIPSKRKKLISRYPLIEKGMTRGDCVKLIKDSGLPVPPKSGCFFCPLQPKASWVRLLKEEPGLFRRARQLEARNNEHRTNLGKKPFHLIPKGLVSVSMSAE